MKVSEAITRTERTKVVREAVEILQSLARHPRLCGLIHDLKLSDSKEEAVVVRPGNWFRSDTFRVEESTLYLTTKGLEERGFIVSGCHREGCGSWSRGTTNPLVRPITDYGQFGIMVEKYDLAPEDLQKILQRLALS
jgi:hypothetical protein